MATATDQAEPKLIIPPLAPFYDVVRDLSWPLIRVTVGGTLLAHGWVKVTVFGVGAVAANALAKRGIEPALPLAYAITFLETVGAVCLMLGLFTRLMAAALAVELAVITFVAHWPNGYFFTASGGGWEYPLLGGLVILAIALRGGGPYSLDRKLGWEL